MNYKDKLTKDFDAIGQIISFTTLLFYDISFFEKEMTKEDRNQFNRFSIFKRMYNSFNSLIILYLSMIYTNNKNDKYTLKKLLNFLINNYKQIAWYDNNKKISMNDLNNSLTELDSLKPIIIELFKLRDNHIAHIDKTNQIHNFKRDDQKKLILKAQEIHDYLNIGLYGASTIWSFIKAESGYSFLNELSTYAVIRETVFGKYMHLEENININELMRIIRKKA